MPVTDYTPSTQDVGKVLRARTRDQYGNIVGDFTDATNPDREAVSGLIADAVDEVAEALGSDLPVDYQAAAKRLATYLAAANVEMSYYPEQAAQNNSMYDKLMARVSALRTSLEEDVAEEEDVPDAPNPSGGFPPASGWDRVSW